MLQDTKHKHLSVEGIGEIAGFKSNSHFHKKFKSLVGLTPNQFRDIAFKSKPIPE
jgi:AraC-like DNA-binding protein